MARLCDTCSTPEAEEGRGFWEFWKGDVCTHVRCSLCELRRRHKVWKETGRIDSKLIMEAMYIAPRSSGREDAFGRDDVVDLTKKPFNAADAIELLTISHRLKSLAERFERKVWFAGLQAYSMAAKVHGHSFEDNDIKVLFMAMAGRAMVTMSNPAGDYDFTLITDESSSSSVMGWQSVNATELQAELLVNTIISKWPVKFRPDKKVGM